MPARDNPFDTIESAHEYVTLLAQQIQDVRADLEKDFAADASPGSSRRLDALRLVDYKLKLLEQHMTGSGRILNDLRVLRRLLLGERQDNQPKLSSIRQT